MANVSGIAGDRLKSFFDRIERLDEEIASLNADKSEVYKEAKGVGFDVKVMRVIVQRRRKEKDELDEADTLLDVYERAIGMRPDFGTEVATRARTETDDYDCGGSDGDEQPKPSTATGPDLDGMRDDGPRTTMEAAAGRANEGQSLMSEPSAIAGSEPARGHPAYVPEIEKLDAAYQLGRAAYLSGGRIDRPPQFPHCEILSAWDRGFTEAATEARQRKLATATVEGRA